MADASVEVELYAVVPEQFVAARAALVRRLRAAGDKVGAAFVAKLRRPTLGAWALNQVARGAPDLIGDLLQAGGRLRAATEQALAGDASGLHPARAAERAAVDIVVNEAAGRMTACGYAVTDVLRQRLAATLRAAVVDETVADLLVRGVIDGDHETPGFGMDSLSAPLTLLPPLVPAPTGVPAPAEVPALPEVAVALPEVAVAASPEVAVPSPEVAVALPEVAVPSPEVAVAASPEVAVAASPEVAVAASPDADAGAEARAAEDRARRQVADHLVAEADALVAEADHWALEAERLMIEATAAAERAALARERADQARDAAGLAHR